MANYTSAGSKIYVSATNPATHDSAGYAALTWTELGETATIGDFGPTYASVTFNPLGDRVTKKAKGSVNYGSTTITAARDEADAGQVLMDAGLLADCPYSFKVEHNDIPCSGGASATIEYFDGFIMSAMSTGLGGPDNTDGVSYTVEINTTVVKVKAA